ncbi:MAG TPA: WcbI family polysaccharide biosynthesis putative acetyltransferase [Caulobacteraceae bacterium]
MAEAQRRTLIVAGNCQASFLYRALKESPELDERYEIIYFRNFRKGDQSELSLDDLSRCAILLEQIAHKAPELPSKHRLADDARVITFPILWMNSLWPTAIKDPRNEPTERHPGGPYPYGDRIVLSLLDQGLTPDQVAQRYLEFDLGEMVDIERFHEINVDKARILDERADVKLGAYVTQNFRASRLFVTQNHPTMTMLRYIADAIFAALEIDPPESDLAQAAGGMQHVHMPVHPVVADHFKLDWYDPEMIYRYFDEQLKLPEFIRRYAAFE